MSPQHSSEPSRDFQALTDPDAPSPRMPWLVWALVNLLAAGGMMGVNAVMADVGSPALLVPLVGLAVGPALVAGRMDGRYRTLAAMIAAGLLLFLLSVVGLTFTDDWQQDDGLGRGFALIFALAGAVVSPVLLVLSFFLGSQSRRFTDG